MAAPTGAVGGESATTSPRKRPRFDSGTSDRSLVVANASASAMSAALSVPRSQCAVCPVLQTELAVLRAELEHAATLRQLDGRKSDQAQGRLRRQIEFLTEEAEEARRLQEETREATEEEIRRMREARTEVIDRLRVAEERMARMAQAESLAGEGALERERRKNRLMEERLEAMQTESERLKARLAEAEKRAADAERRVAVAEAATENEEEDKGEGGTAAEMGTPESRSRAPKSLVSPAAMSELNRVRVKLAESERHGRQLARRLESAQREAEKSVRNCEAAQHAEARMEGLEEELRSLLNEREVAKATEGQWVDFRREIKGFFDDEVCADNLDEGYDSNESMPPEIGAVLRNFRSLSKKVRQLEEDKAFAESQMDSSQRRAKVLERQLNDAIAAEESWRSKKKELEMKVEETDTALKKVKAQEKIWQREADSLRSLLKTYENIQDAGIKKSGATASFSPFACSAGAQDKGKGPTISGLELGLASAREQINVLKEETEKMHQEAEAAKEETKNVKAEHERVLEKFGKLRDALLKEREKAEKAEERAAQAETLVGKGHFNDETTRALHLKKNPFMQAVREKFQKDIDVLKKELEEKEAELATATGYAHRTTMKTPPSAGSAGSVTSKGEKLSSLDAQKLHRRLKESFKEQIGLFREGVYLITGYKVDMFADSDRPRFRVRSLYSDQEDDHLMFLWPKTKRGQELSVTSLDLVDTEMAQVLAQSPSFEYMTKYNSTPAFMASTQLSLFEKLTFAG